MKFLKIKIEDIENCKLLGNVKINNLTKCKDKDYVVIHEELLNSEDISKLEKEEKLLKIDVKDVWKHLEDKPLTIEDI